VVTDWRFSFKLEWRRCFSVLNGAFINTLAWITHLMHFMLGEECTSLSRCYFVNHIVLSRACIIATKMQSRICEDSAQATFTTTSVSLQCL
jgi:hypothetical protein